MIEEGEWGGFTVTCDRCSYDEDYEEETWSEMNAAIKHEGWQILKSEDVFEHICPNCAQAAR